MAKEPESREGGDGRPTKRQSVPLEGAALAFAIFSVVNDQAATDEAAKLALRGPEPLGQMVRTLLLMQGRDPEQLVSGEPTTPPTRAEFRALAEPTLRKGATLAGLAQLMSIYLLDESSTPEEVIIVIYILLRLLVAGNREPSGEEGRRIWAAVLELAPTPRSSHHDGKSMKSGAEFTSKDGLRRSKRRPAASSEHFSGA